MSLLRTEELLDALAMPLTEAAALMPSVRVRMSTARTRDDAPRVFRMVATSGEARSTSFPARRSACCAASGSSKIFREEDGVSPRGMLPAVPAAVVATLDENWREEPGRRAFAGFHEAAARRRTRSEQ